MSVGLPLQTLCDAAIRAARAAGEVLQHVDRATLVPRHKAAGSSVASQVVTEVDLRCEALIRDHLDELSRQWDIAFVGEESSAGATTAADERFHKHCFWCVDPLDGTLPFVEGRSGYAVSIALVTRAGEPLIGVVYDPSERSVLHAIKGQGAYRDMESLTPPTSEPDELTIFADTSLRSHADYDSLCEHLKSCASTSGLAGIELVYGNGAVKNACQVLRFPAACYIKLPRPEAGGGSIWDFAATACIVREAGAWVSNIDGHPLELNREDSTFMNHQGVVYASSEALARSLLAGLL